MKCEGGSRLLHATTHMSSPGAMSSSSCRFKFVVHQVRSSLLRWLCLMCHIICTVIRVGKQQRQHLYVRIGVEQPLERGLEPRRQRRHRVTLTHCQAQVSTSPMKTHGMGGGETGGQDTAGEARNGNRLSRSRPHSHVPV